MASISNANRKNNNTVSQAPQYFTIVLRISAQQRLAAVRAGIQLENEHRLSLPTGNPLLIGIDQEGNAELTPDLFSGGWGNGNSRYFQFEEMEHNNAFISSLIGGAQPQAALDSLVPTLMGAAEAEKKKKEEEKRKSEVEKKRREEEEELRSRAKAYLQPEIDSLNSDLERVRSWWREEEQKAGMLARFISKQGLGSEFLHWRAAETVKTAEKSTSFEEEFGVEEEESE